jgi:hypothetical protein
VLQSTWVKIYGLPGIACKKEVVMKVAMLVGEPVVVDELSLIKIGPVRVKINCKDPYRLRGFVKFFFNNLGYAICFVSEKFKDNSSRPPSPPSKREDDDDEGRGRRNQMGTGT